MRGALSVAAVALRPLTDNAADTVRGIALAVLAYLVLTLGDVVAKSALVAAGVGGVMLGRGIFGAAAVLTVAAARPGPAGWRRVLPVRRGWVLARAGLAAFVSVSWYNSWRVMALADTYAVGYIAPLLMTVLAVPLLGERIRWRRALSTSVGFGGVLLMLRPGGLPWTPMLALLLAGTVGMAVTRIMTRLLSATETPECQAFWQLAAHGVAGAALLTVLPGVGGVGPAVWLALAVLGVSSGLAHCVFARAYALAPVSALAPYEYTMLLWGGVAGFVVFGEVPGWSTLAGAAVVAAAGLYNWHRETKNLSRGSGRGQGRVSARG
ncbi:MAG: DMT family transporter [Acetobacteraceae bacterium]|jgi:drug/metabolite transporter (DMT)-like permease